MKGPRREQLYAFNCGKSDAHKRRLDGWANHSPSYQAGQVMARVEQEMSLATSRSQHEGAE